MKLFVYILSLVLCFNAFSQERPNITANAQLDTFFLVTDSSKIVIGFISYEGKDLIITRIDSTTIDIRDFGPIVLFQDGIIYNGEGQNYDCADMFQHKIEHPHPNPISVIPFVLLLLMIATGPLFYEHFWHHHYPKVAFILSAIVISYYALGLQNISSPIHAGFEYFQFISLLAALYVASGGIYIEVNTESKPLVNLIILLIGAFIANLIGTTGASMLLIRPFMTLNKDRIRAYHIVFFIFIVSNVGGALTPIGDPPLFLGFLKGIPFEWSITNNFSAWAFCVTLLAIVFYLMDSHHYNKTDKTPRSFDSKPLVIRGKKNFLWLSLIIIAVFIDPNIFEGVPSIQYHGVKFSFIRELIMLSVGTLAYLTTSKEIIKINEFNFEPIKEVAFIFVGIFGTMMPALELISDFAASPAGIAVINQNTLYWGTGILSGFLDNAPTYLNFLTAAMASHGYDINNQQDVIGFCTY